MCLQYTPATLEKKEILCGLQNIFVIEAGREAKFKKSILQSSQQSSEPFTLRSDEQHLFIRKDYKHSRLQAVMWTCEMILHKEIYSTSVCSFFFK